MRKSGSKWQQGKRPLTCYTVTFATVTVNSPHLASSSARGGSSRSTSARIRRRGLLSSAFRWSSARKRCMARVRRSLSRVVCAGPYLGHARQSAKKNSRPDRQRRPPSVFDVGCHELSSCSGRRGPIHCLAPRRKLAAPSLALPSCHRSSLFLADAQPERARVCVCVPRFLPALLPTCL